MKSKLGINGIKILSLACAGTFYTNEIEVYVGKQIGEKIACPRQDAMNVECSYAKSILQDSAHCPACCINYAQGEEEETEDSE